MTRDSFSPAVPRFACARRVHPLLRFTPLQSAASLRSAPDPKAGCAFLGVRGPSSRRPPSASYAPSDPTARCLAALGVSHALDGFLRGWPCGSISPRCHVQGSLFRGFLLVRSRIVFQRPLPSRRCPGFADRQLPACLRSTEPRPQGFAPRPNPRLNHRGLADARARFPS